MDYYDTSNLQVVSPDAAHDFPPQVRLQAYRFIDKVLNHAPDIEVIRITVYPNRKLSGS